MADEQNNQTTEPTNETENEDTSGDKGTPPDQETLDRKAKAEQSRKANKAAKENARPDVAGVPGPDEPDPNSYREADVADPKVAGFLNNPVAGGAVPSSVEITDADRTPFPEASKPKF